MTYKHELWQELYVKQYTKPIDEGQPGGWRTKSDWMIELNRIRNQNDHDYAVTEEEYDCLFAVNVKGTFFACQHAARRMADGGWPMAGASSTSLPPPRP